MAWTDKIQPSWDEYLSSIPLNERSKLVSLQNIIDSEREIGNHGVEPGSLQCEINEDSVDIEIDYN